MKVTRAQGESLRQAVREMTSRQMLYRVLKEELTALGYWRNLTIGLG